MAPGSKPTYVAGDKPFVSVIVPVFNEPCRLGACLAALEAQSYAPSRYEVIVVDNGSDPPVGSLSDNFPHSALLQEPTPGSYNARNAGIGLAKGEILALLESPDVVEIR